jgi:hypothetical protein
MNAHVTLDGSDWSKAQHQRNMAATNKLLCLLYQHHADTMPAFLPAPKPTAAPERVIEVVEPAPVPAPPPVATEDRDWLFVTPRPVTTIKDIQMTVAKHYGFTCMDMRSKRRTAALAKARHVAMYVVKSVTPRSLPEIGYYFGGRDHTTVLHAVRRIDGLVATDEAFRAEVDGLKSQFEAPQ